MNFILNFAIAIFWLVKSLIGALLRLAMDLLKWLRRLMPQKKGSESEW